MYTVICVTIGVAYLEQYKIEYCCVVHFHCTPLKGCSIRAMVIMVFYGILSFTAVIHDYLLTTLPRTGSTIHLYNVISYIKLCCLQQCYSVRGTRTTAGVRDIVCRYAECFQQNKETVVTFHAMEDCKNI